MTKAELVAAVAERAGVSKKVADAVLDAYFRVVQDAVAEGKEVRVPGFGAFVVRERAARKVKDPRTGEEITVPARKVVVFKPFAALREAAL